MTIGNRSRSVHSGVRFGRLALAVAGCFAALGAAPARAGDFVLDNGIEGRWSLNASIGTSRRVRTADPNLIMRGNVGNSGSSHDDGNLNYQRGDTFSTIAKTVGELSLKRDNIGVFIRAKAWYDFELERGDVHHGSAANGYQRETPLNDSQFDRLSKFKGFDIADAYVFANTEVAGDHPLSIKFGNHVVNWGESLFVPGINQFGAFDLAAARRPGSQVKEILLPIPQISANLGLTDSLSVEAFYQLAWRKNILDGCGTYWSISDLYNCSDRGVPIGAGALAASTDQELFGPTPSLIASATNAILFNAGNIKPGSSGQWGIAARYFAQEIGTEFGAYFANYNQRSPVISALGNASPAPSAFNLTLGPPNPQRFMLNYKWDWSAEDIKVYGLSFSTVLKGWSVFGELSQTKNLPVQINGVDLLRGATNGAGPMGFLRAMTRNANILQHGYDRKDKTQFQVSTLKLFPQVAGAEQLSLIGEVAVQHWDGIGNPYTSRRYGRAFVFGQAAWGGTAPFPTTCGGPIATSSSTNASYCDTDGYATKNAWGYRLQGELSYPDAFAGVNLKPRVFWSHDVKGYSADNIFLQDRQVLSLGARFDYLARYYADLSYSRYNHNAKYDIFHDRDFVSVVVGMNF